MDAAIEMVDLWSGSSGYDVCLLVELLTGLHRRYPDLKIILEPGSAFAWQTGPLVAQVVDVV